MAKQPGMTKTMYKRPERIVLLLTHPALFYLIGIGSVLSFPWGI